MSKNEILALILEEAYPVPPTVREGSAPLKEGRPRRPVIGDELQMEIVAIETLAGRNERRLQELRDSGAITGL